MGNILLVWDRVGDYHLARYNNLKAYYKAGSVSLAELGSKDNLYKWELNETEIHSLSQKPVENFDIINRTFNFYNFIKRKDIQHIFISGYGKIEYLLFIIIGKLLGCKVYLFAESWYNKNRLILYLKKIFLSFFVKGLFVSGQRAKKYFKKEVNLSTMPIQTGYSVIDNEHFVKGIEKRNILLCVARYSEEKNLMFLINCFKKSKLSDSYQLHLVGDGPLRKQLVDNVEDTSNIIIDRWYPYDELPKVYNEAKYLILASLFEPWGLVVNEGMAASLPTLISNRCGCLPDLDAHKGELVFDPQCEESLINKLNLLYYLNDTDYTKLCNESKLKISSVTLKDWASNLIKLTNQT